MQLLMAMQVVAELKSMGFDEGARLGLEGH
jgi:hypothetical protein